MADQSLRSARADVSLTIPATYVDRFRYQAQFTLGPAADQIDEATRWNQEGKVPRGESEVRTVTVDELDKFEQAEVVFKQLGLVDAGDLTIEGSLSTIVSTLHGCELAAADKIMGEAEAVDGNTRAAIAEFEHWRGLREQLA